MKQDDFIDVDFIEEDSIELDDIAKKIKYFTSKQVCEVLNISSTTLTYYTSFFEDILNVQKGGNQRRYDESCIKTLKFICDLKAKGFPLLQIKEICEETEFKDGKALIKESNPLSIQALAQAMLNEQAEKLEKMKFEIVDEVSDKLINYLKTQKENELTVFEGIKDDINISIEANIEKKLNELSSDIKESLGMKFISRDELENYTKKKSLWNKLLKRG